ncbi:hypothetical protein [Mesorhizobium sp.]|uniref:hypothetical protein n=1 Tax=Mesorhizobium sp. TaxID=1871066 RepID=UPI0025795DA5|nr:hypothetical protein [Mesorhizobium sp.]
MSPFSRFTDAEVREMLRGAGMPDQLDDANIRSLGLVRVQTQRQQVLAAYAINPDVDAIFTNLRGAVPKSSIRAYLCRAVPDGEWRVRNRRGSGRAA